VNYTTWASVPNSIRAVTGSETSSWGIGNLEVVDEPNQEEGGCATRDKRPPPWMAGFYIN